MARINPRGRGRPRSRNPRTHRVVFYLNAAEWARLQFYRASLARRPQAATVARTALLAFLSAAGVP